MPHLPPPLVFFWSLFYQRGYLWLPYFPPCLGKISATESLKFIHRLFPRGRPVPPGPVLVGREAMRCFDALNPRPQRGEFRIVQAPPQSLRMELFDDFSLEEQSLCLVQLPCRLRGTNRG